MVYPMRPTTHIAQVAAAKIGCLVADTRVLNWKLDFGRQVGKGSRTELEPLVCSREYFGEHLVENRG